MNQFVNLSDAQIKKIFDKGYSEMLNEHGQMVIITIDDLYFKLKDFEKVKLWIETRNIKL